ncbi:MAG: competence/damage-inducible protein A [Candidatus Kapabacteria bacterium]|nr:competence/damage-inducible protein A [Candidatus Kapabacteria bacterium]
MLKISILTIGDEICIGQIINSNAAWIASQCTGAGAMVIVHSSIGDVKEDILNELKRLSQISDLILITGGLGPTHDDITKITLAEYFNSPLVQHDETLRNLELIFARRNFVLTDRNRGQAMVPANCTILTNKVGTAPGMLFEFNDVKYISMPGVPAEMKYIMSNSVIPMINESISSKNKDVICFKTLMTSGVPESTLADLIGETSDFLKTGETLAFLPSYHGVKLRLGASALTFASAETRLNELSKYLLEKIGQFVFSDEDRSILEVLKERLIQEELTVAIAESCTAGMLGAALTEPRGSSAYFLGGVQSYSNEVKINILKVKSTTIETHGAVSEETAIEMAENVRNIFGSDFGISITGIAGPDGGTQEKPVGTVWIGISDHNGCSAKRFSFSFDRQVNRDRAVGTALNMLLKKLI